MAIPLNVLIYALIGAGIVGLVVWSIYRYKLINASEKWVSMMGRVTEAHVHRTKDLQNRETMSPYPVIHYQYTVNGQTFQGSRISFAPTTALSLDWVDKYPAGTDVKVYYDPKNPQNAVLVPGRAGMSPDNYEPPE